MIYQVHPATRETPAELDYSAPVRCINCEATHDADDHAHLLTEVGYDSNRQMQHLCDDCADAFRCFTCKEVSLDVTRGEDEELICEDCQRELDGAEIA